jgi:hypothetical protein
MTPSAFVRPGPGLNGRFASVGLDVESATSTAHDGTTPGSELGLNFHGVGIDDLNANWPLVHINNELHGCGRADCIASERIPPTA